MLIQAYHIQTTILQNGFINLTNLQVHDGETVEVIVLAQPPRSIPASRYPLRGAPLTFLNSTEPVAQENWVVEH
ncbi:MAG: hypothetical protein AB1656_17100 [Candidatus Omnitrophota bacterium]